MTIRLFLIALGALSLLMSVQCPQTNPQEHCDGSVFIVKPLTVPAADPTGPTASLGVLGNGINVTATSTSGVVNLKINGTEYLVFTATGADPESGIGTVEIWNSVTKWQMSGGYESKIGPGMVDRPSAANADAQLPKKAGDSACEARHVSLSLNMADFVRGVSAAEIVVSTNTVNSFGAKSGATVVLRWN